jgi:uncharacterized membrane protein
VTGMAGAIWKVLALAEVGNFLDWITTVVGVGGMGLHELNATAAWYIRMLGAFWGTTVVKAAVGVELAVIAAVGELLLSRAGVDARRRAAACAACMVVLGLMGALLWAVSASNALVLLAASLSR